MRQGNRFVAVAAVNPRQRRAPSGTAVIRWQEARSDYLRPPVHEYLGHVDHVERSPCRRPPSSTGGRLLHLDGQVHHDTHALRMENYVIGGIRDRQPLIAGELQDRRPACV